MTATKLLAFALLLIAPSVATAQVFIDSDNDGLSDSEELRYATDPLKADTDGDGFLDKNEIDYGYSPRHGDNMKLDEVDSDNDYLIDAWELLIGTGIMEPDSDKDGYLDGTEVAASHDPLSNTTEKLEKHIFVNLEDQELWYTFNGIELDRFPISSGLRYTPTPPGEYEVLNKIPTKAYVGANYNYPNTKWNLHFLTQRLGFYIHGAYWHNNFGTPMSHGCVNVHYDNMENLYWFAELGTEITIQ